MIGEGIKRIPAYICNIPYDKLNNLRERFWKSRIHYKRIWRAIRECCESDADTAVILLEAAEMACVHNDLREVIVLENPDYVFKVPNFCICDPIFDRDYDEIQQYNEGIVEKKIIIIICYIDNNKEMKEKKIENITNKSMVIDLKKKFAEMVDIDMEKNKIRLFYKGFELLDDNLLWYDKVENMAKIQCMISFNHEEIEE